MEMSETEIARWEGEGGGTAHHPDGGHMDQERQHAEIERLKARLDNVGGGVPLMGREERAIHAILAMATIMRGALDDFMYAGAAVSSDCPPTLNRLLALMQDIIGAIRGVVIIQPEDNVALLLAKCEGAIREMERARGVQTEPGKTQRPGERFQKMAASLGEFSEPVAPAN